MPKRRAAAVTLIELLCVLAIILILVGLLLGPVMRAYKKAKNFGWENDSIQLADRFQERMAQHFGSAVEYPARTVEQLYAEGLIDSTLRKFLKDRRVHFFPFSSKTPEESIVLQVMVSRSYVATVQKSQLKPPKD